VVLPIAKIQSSVSPVGVTDDESRVRGNRTPTARGFDPVDRQQDAPTPTGVQGTPAAARGVSAGAFLQLSAADQARAATVGTEALVALKRALAQATLIDPLDRERAFAAAVASPHNFRRALACFAGKSVTQVVDADVAALTSPPVSVGKAAWDLVAWTRRQAAARVCQGVHGSLTAILRRELDATGEAALFWAAIDGIEAIKRESKASTAVGDLLEARGCLPPRPVWTLVGELLPGSDPIAVLAGKPPRPDATRPPLRRDRPIFRVLLRRLLASELLRSEEWQSHMISLDVTRGLVGENVRLAQIATTPADTGCRAIQGALVLLAPAGLWACADSDAARAWCEGNGYPTRGLYRVKLEDGAHFGLLQTEVDVTLVREQGERLEVVRLENVKASDGLASEARHQNQVVLSALGHADLRFCVPAPGDAYTEVTDRLARDAESLRRVATVTVGPEGGDAYDVRMPLTEAEITQLTKDLVLAALAKR
jgi:hypothetical protein